MPTRLHKTSQRERAGDVVQITGQHLGPHGWAAGVPLVVGLQRGQRERLPGLQEPLLRRKQLSQNCSLIQGHACQRQQV